MATNFNYLHYPRYDNKRKTTLLTRRNNNENIEQRQTSNTKDNTRIISNQKLSDKNKSSK